jgi:hypothetical protein
MTVGPIAANVTCYPDFVEGQVLTHNDLNLLRDYLYSRWAFENSCLFGFGVACGLKGTAGTQLSIASGFVLAQDGRLLRVADPVTFDWSNIATLAAGITPADYGIDFLTGPGYTAVLVPNDTKKPLDKTCDPQAGCAAHTDQWCEGAQIVFAAGQLAVTGWAADLAFKISPVDVDPKNGASKTAFNTLNAALRNALKNLVPADTITLLGQLSLDGPAGVDLMKVGLLNEVLFTLWDYIRCRAYDQQSACCGPGGKAAVALGWIDPAKKTWDCTYRHHFQLSTALYLAIEGYRCEDLCSRYIDHILDLIQNFVPPTIPATTPPSNPPPAHSCTLEEFRTKRCNWRGPHEKVDLRHLPGYVAFDPTRQPHPGDPSPVERYQFVVDDSWITTTMGLAIDPTNSGLVRLGDYLGFQDTASKKELDKVITGGVQVVDVANFGNVPNMQRAVVAARSDAVVLAKNTYGTVVGMGVIPTAHTLQQVPALSVGVADAKAASALAVDSANKASARADIAARQALDVQSNFTKLSGDLDKFEQQYSDKFAGAPEVGKLQQAAQLVENWQPIDKGYQAAQRDILLVQQQLVTHKQTLDKLSDTATKISDRVDNFGSRLDVQAIAIHSGADVGRMGAVNASIIGAFDALGVALVKAAGPDRVAAVKAAVDKAQTYVDTLRSDASGLLVTDAHPQVLANAMGSMLHAVAATGLNKNTNAYRDLTRSLDELALALGTKIGSTG